MQFVTLAHDGVIGTYYLALVCKAYDFHMRIIHSRGIRTYQHNVTILPIDPNPTRFVNLTLQKVDLSQPNTAIAALQQVCELGICIHSY